LNLASNIWTVLKLSRPRYLALTIPPFLVGGLAAPQLNETYLGVGAMALVVLRAISSIGNCLTDRIEDKVDHPVRVRLCEHVGYHRLERLVQFLVLVYLALLTWMAVSLHIHILALILWVGFLLIKLAYSFGPRLKPKRFSATVLLGGVSGGMLLLGWLGGGAHDLLTPIFAGVLMWAMGLSLLGSKDAPNVEGDAVIGYRSVYRDLMEGSSPLGRALFVVTRPYILALLLAPLSAVVGGPGLRFAWCLAAYPAAIGFATILVNADSFSGRSIVREAGYVYWIIFMDVVLLAVLPDRQTIVICLAALLWYFAASRFLHPDPTPYSGDGFRAFRPPASHA
jgi:4-hydroxybenzoate polyprenyltransferase